MPFGHCQSRPVFHTQHDRCASARPGTELPAPRKLSGEDRSPTDSPVRKRIQPGMLRKSSHAANAGGGYQQKGVADGLLNGGGFFFRIFWLIQRNNIVYAVRPTRLRHPRTDFRRAYRIGFATPPVKSALLPDSHATAECLPPTAVSYC